MNTDNSSTWLGNVDEYMASARDDINAERHRKAIISMQQAIEFALKGLQIAVQKRANSQSKGHDLLKLRNDVADSIERNPNVDNFQSEYLMKNKFDECLFTLSEVQNKMRYPNDTRYDEFKYDASNFIKAAEELVNWAKQTATNSKSI